MDISSDKRPVSLPPQTVGEAFSVLLIQQKRDSPQSSFNLHLSGDEVGHLFIYLNTGCVNVFFISDPIFNFFHFVFKISKMISKTYHCT